MKEEAKKVCLYPRLGPRATGGVAVHLRTLAQGLTARGWQVVAEPDERTIIHGHAICNAPRLSCYTSHGVYPLRERMPRWQQDANATLFANLKLAEQVIAVSRWTAAQWSHLVGREPHIIYNAVNVDDWTNLRAGHWRMKLGLTERDPLVLWGKTGLSEVLDPTPLVELALHYPYWHFVTPLDPRLLHTAPTNLHRIGPQPFELMQMLVRDCDVYLATVCENHSIQVLEAMAAERAILGFDWGGTAETVTPECGRLVKARDLRALVGALPEVYDQRQVLGQAARAHVAEQFSVERHLDAVEEVYALAKNDRPRQGDGKWTSATPVKCSIIIPVYNKAAYVADTIRSAMRQTLGAPRYEVIVIDDGSTDNSYEVIRRTAAEFAAETTGRGARRILRHESRPNAGVSATRNYGITIAKGEYICCLDADDLIDAHFLERMSAALDADPGLGIAYSDFITFGQDEAGNPWESYITCSEYNFEQLKRGNLLPCCNLFRKVAWERAGGYKPINPSWEDYELWLNMGKLGWYGRRVPGGLFRYRKVVAVGRDHESHGQEWRLRGTVNKYHRDLYPPLISVVIPTYKHSQFLRDAIESARAQTMPDHEIVVVDDGDEAAEAAKVREIVEGYGDPDLRLIQLTENGGLANARNTGIEAARGTWIMPLDADDKLAPRFMELALKATNLEPQKFAYTDSYLWWPDKPEGQQLTKLEAHDYDFDEMLTRITWACAILFHKSAWERTGGYKPQMSEAGGWEDWEYAINMGENGICGVRVAEPLFFYRQHSQEQMRYKAQANKPLLQETLRRLHPDVYRGERTVACCGGHNRQRDIQNGVAEAQPVRAETAAAPRAVPVAVQPANDVLIRYVGRQRGAQTWRVPSGAAYRFAWGKPLRVRSQDAAYFDGHPDFQRVSV